MDDLQSLVERNTSSREGEAVQGREDPPRRARPVRGVAHVPGGDPDRGRASRAGRRDRRPHPRREREPLGGHDRGGSRTAEDDGERDRAAASSTSRPFGSSARRQTGCRTTSTRLRELFGLDPGSEPLEGAQAEVTELDERRRAGAGRSDAVRIATRSSALALAQAGAVAEASAAPSWFTSRTSTARSATRRASSRTVEEALRDGRADLGVHSAKDLPGECPTTWHWSGCRCARTRPTPSSARRLRSPTCRGRARRHRKPPAPLAAAGASPRPGGGRDPRQRGHAASKARRR